MARSSRRSQSGNKLAILTPNQKQNIIKKERERRRIARYVQVRQMSAENASQIREKVKKAKAKKEVEIRKKITDALVSQASNKENLASDQLEKVNRLPTPRRGRRPLTKDELDRATRRHQEALRRLRRERGVKRQNVESAVQRRRLASQAANANAKSI